jgi:hypothetical protein
MHEATKKSHGLRRGEPLNTPSIETDRSLDGKRAAARLSKEYEMRKMDAANGTRTSQRKVIPSNGHTRTLSLLSPDRCGPPPAFPRAPQPASTNGHDGVLARSTTLSDQNKAAHKNSAGKLARHSYQGPTHDSVLRTGQKFAEDFKEGLWTFIEDLRQATVGDEGVNGTGTRITATGPANVARRQTSKSSLKNQGKSSGRRSKLEDVPSTDGAALIDIGGAFWKEHGIEPTPKKSAQTKLGPNEAREVDESWENWDSPAPRTSSPRWSSSTFVSDVYATDGDFSLSAEESSRRTSNRQVFP